MHCEGGADRFPLRRRDPSHEPETAVPRPKDQSLSLLKREPGGVAHDDSVGDEDGERAGGGPRTDEATRRTNLPAPGLVVGGIDRVQEGGLDLAAAEGETRRLPRAAERARQPGPDAEVEPCDASPDRARLRATGCRQVPLRRAIGEDDRILVLLRLVG